MARNVFSKKGNDLKLPLIIAMQGNHCSGKSTLANMLARELKCASIRLDDILPDTICPSDKPEVVILQAFDVITRIVRTQTSLGLSIIVDSPLARLAHLDKLVAVLRTGRDATRLIIIECKPGTSYMLQLGFEKHSSHSKKWYEPRSWPFDPEFSRDYTNEVEGNPMVSKLIVNTTNFFSIKDIVAGLRDLSSAAGGQEIEYDKWLLNTRCKSVAGMHKLDRLREKDYNSSTRKYKSLCSKNPHQVRLECTRTEKRSAADATCGVCQIPMFQSADGGAAYLCSRCPLAIHKSCAELVDNGDSPRPVFAPPNFPEFIKFKPEATYCYPEEHLCLRCAKQERKEFSYKCVSCVFECHMKCRLVPTIVNHPAHDHTLFFWAYTTSVRFFYLCMACRTRGRYTVYSCVNHCMDNYYHPKCLLLPTSLPEHVHGGHAHGLQMVFKREEELEDYICHLCFEHMNPDAWYYSCNSCQIDLHLACAFLEFDLM